MLFQYENQHWVVHIHFVVCLTFLTVKQQLPPCRANHAVRLASLTSCPMPRLLRKMVVPTTLPSRRMEAEDALPTTLRARGTEVKPIQEVFDDPATYDHLLPKSWIACPRCSSYTCVCTVDDYQFSRHLQEKKHRCVLHCNGNLHFSCTPVNVISRKLREPSVEVIVHMCVHRG